MAQSNAGKAKKNTREQRKKQTVRIVAIVACAALLLTSVLSLVATSLIR